MSSDKSNEWPAKETSTHQDHVIAHVIGASVLAYFVLDEALHVLLDIGFLWTIYLDGQMVLLPQTAALSELEVDAETRRELSLEIELLGRDGRSAQDVERLIPPPLDCLITAVGFFANGERRRLVLAGEAANLTVETSLATGAIEVTANAN